MPFTISELAQRSLTTLLAVLLVTATLVLVAPQPAVRADGSPDISLSKSMPGEALAGDPAIPVTLTATNPAGGGTDGFNLTFVDVLPPGVSLVAGSPAPSQVLTNTPGAGQTTLVWSNVSDLQEGVTESISYTMTHDGSLTVGDSITNSASAYVNSDPRIVPVYNPDTDLVDNGTGNAADAATTDLVPFLIVKSEPGTEAELLRGLHDHQTVYTLEILNNYVASSNTFAIEDWIPAGMEFLGCGADDFSTTVGNDFPGPINPGNAPAMTNPCVAPDTVETIVTDPPGAAPSGVYTHVVWSAATLGLTLGTTGPARTARYDYIAAIPQRANTTTWDGTLGEPADTGAQGSNIDNNNGLLTQETLVEQGMSNLVRLSGVFTGDSGTYTDDDQMAVSAEDLSIHKSVNNGAITQGADSTWTLLIETSEYTATATNIVVTDTLPDGLCPLGAGSPDTECQAAGTPSQAYTSSTENSGGTWTLVWNVADMGRSESTTITFPTKTRTSYQDAFDDDLPVVASDSWVNTVELTGTVDGRPVLDDSSAGQEAAPVIILKEVATRPAGGVCGDGSGLTWNTPPTEPAYHVGDRVCWRLTVSYPTDLDTFDSDIQDYLPPGHTYIIDPSPLADPDSWQLGEGTSTLPPLVTFNDADAGIGLLEWTVGSAAGYVDEGVTVEIVLSSTITDAKATTSGTIVANLMKFSYTNSADVPFNLRSQADIEVIEPEVDLVKGIERITRGVTVVEGPNVDPNVDGKPVIADDVVTYQLTVTNTGDLAADDVEVWDLLPVEWAPCSTVVTAISDDGVCDDGNNRIVWDGANVFSVVPGGSKVLTYNVTVPSLVAPGFTMVNTAGVRTYTGATNRSTGLFDFYPESNIDTGAPTATAATADDPSNVFTAAPTITKTAITDLDEAGNAEPDEATIGEEITYTATVVIPQGTTVHGPAVFTDTLAPELELLSASYTFDGVPAVDPGYPTIDVNTTTDVVTVTFADPYTNPIGTDDTLTVTIIARVANVPANVIGADVQNNAQFQWENAAGADAEAIQARVTTDIVEPDISLSKTNDDLDSVVIGGDTVTYTLGITNGSGDDVSVAHDIVVLDILPEGITPSSISDGGVFTPDGIPGNGVLGTIRWTITSVDPATTVNRTYDVTIDSPVVVSTSFTNNATVSATSMADTPTGERTSGVGYADTATDTLNTPLMSITKSVDPATATIGDILSYELEVTIPASAIVFDATVLDTLPAGVSFDGITGSSCASAGGGVCDSDITVTQLGTVGTQTAAFFLGDIAVPAANDEDRIITLTYDAHLLDSGSSGDTRINSANVYGNQTDVIAGTPGLPLVTGDFDVAGDPATATVTIVEPTLTIDKDVSGQVGDTDARRAVPGDFLTYTVVVENTGTSDANDITVTDTPDNRLIAISITGGTGYVVDDADLADGTLQWTIAGPMAPGDTITISYDVQIPGTLGSADEIVAGPEVTNIADVPSYYGVPEIERDANPTHTYRLYNDVVPDQVDIELDLASIGDRIWFDVDADGDQESGEPGLVGIDVTITYLGLDGELGGGDDETFSATTGANGIWLVEDLPGGEYRVVVDTADVPAGMAASYDLDDGTSAPDDAWQGPLGEDEDKRNVDFGYTGTGSIGDTVWFDRNDNGVVDGDEYGLEDVDVTVTWFGLDGVSGGSDDIAYSVTTDATGTYVVANLPAGNYSVDVDDLTLPTGMEPTYDGDGTITPHTSLVALPAGENNRDQDFGYNGAGSIGDFVWLDSNGDGAHDTGELGIPDVPIRLTWPGEDGVLGGGDDETFVTTTDAFGMYLFEGLPPGEYQVDVTGGLPLAADNTFDEEGPLDSSAVVDLSNGEDHLTTDFGYQGTATIGDTVWWDLDNNGDIDVDEPGIPGVEVTLTYGGVDGIIGNADDLVFTTTTDNTGAYSFTNLPAGNFEVTVTDGVPAGMAPTSDEDGGDDETSSVTGLAVGDIHLTADFGYTGTGSIGDFVWIDLDADGFQDAGEPGIPGVEVTLTWYGFDNTLGGGDDLVLTTTTDIDGNYLFPTLPAGGYDVAIETATLPTGVIQTYDNDGLTSPDTSTLLLAAGENNRDQDFGYNGTASIGDTIWFDRDGDGSIGIDEYGIGGVGVDITWAGPDGLFATADDEVFPTTTDINGVYLRTDLPPGDYTVTVDTGTLPPGMAPISDEDGTLDNETSFALAEGEAHLTADFGYRGTGSIGDFVWLDIDGDGSQDTDEPGIPAQTVELVWDGPDGIAGNSDDQTYTTMTDSNGAYLFDNLPPGEYAVTVTGPITTAAAPTFDEEGPLDSSAIVSLADDENHLTTDFGYQGTVEIGDTVWLDLDGDGVEDAGEPGIAGVEVTVTWYGASGAPGGGDDVVFPPLTTDENGRYLATGLPDGNFGVAITGGIPTGLVNSADEDSDLDGQADVSGLSAGDSHLTADFGYTGTGTIGDTIWWDLDGDSVPDAGEPGFPGVEVTLNWVGLDGIVGNADDQVFTTTTDTSGGYLFENLPPGSYEVVVDETDLPPGVFATADPDGGSDGMSALVLGDGESNLDQDFGYRGVGSIGDHIWYDLNDDGIQDLNEPGLGGVDVVVTYFGADGAIGGGDDIIFAATADANGDYLVPGLPAGTYDIALDPASVPPGLVPSVDVDGGDPATSTVVLGLAEIRDDVDFGVVGDASLGGTVWNDVDGDGVRDPGETGVPNVTIIVTWNGPDGPVEILVVTDAVGSWNLPALPPGDYDVVLDEATIPPGTSPTTAANESVTLPVGGREVVDVGIAEVVMLGSTVWIDTDDDGVPDANELGIQGVRVNLYAADGTLVSSTVTDADGEYLFTDLTPGSYRVEIESDTVPTNLRATFDRDGTTDLMTTVVLTGGSNVLDANFGFQEGLPTTGSDLARYFWIGLIILLAGVALVLDAERKGRPDA